MDPCLCPALARAEWRLELETFVQAGVLIGPLGEISNTGTVVRIVWYVLTYV